ncbi:RNA-directed DNA polymerase, eukaryota, reverse transcriptase zinc-binding domain protein [Tanacetum coccineum]
MEGFDKFIETSWLSMNIAYSNGLIRMKKKLQLLKNAIKIWVKENKTKINATKSSIQHKLSEVDKIIDLGGGNDEIINKRSSLMKDLYDINSIDALDLSQKAKVRWSIEGDENSNYSHGILNSKRSNLLSEEFFFMVTGSWNRLSPFILNELIFWCKHKKINAMIFKVDFEKAFDSVRWDYLDDVLKSFGFGDKRRSWISGCLLSFMGSVLINGSPTLEFHFHKGLKQGDPLSPFLFILITESLHLSFTRVLDSGLFKGINISNSLTLSYLFYADDAVFIDQ